MTWTLCKHGGPSPAEATLSADLTAARARSAVQPVPCVVTVDGVEVLLGSVRWSVSPPAWRHATVPR